MSKIIFWNEWKTFKLVLRSINCNVVYPYIKIHSGVAHIYYVRAFSKKAWKLKQGQTVEQKDEHFTRMITKLDSFVSKNFLLYFMALISLVGKEMEDIWWLWSNLSLELELIYWVWNGLFNAPLISTQGGIDIPKEKMNQTERFLRNWK